MLYSICNLSDITSIYLYIVIKRRMNSKIIVAVDIRLKIETSTVLSDEEKKSFLRFVAYMTEEEKKELLKMI